jgi:hypothetical protein
MLSSDNTVLLKHLPILPSKHACTEIQCAPDKLTSLNILLTSFIEGAAQRLEIFTACVPCHCADSIEVLLTYG